MQIAERSTLFMSESPGGFTIVLIILNDDIELIVKLTGILKT